MNNTKHCSVPECNSKVLMKGLCSAHYQRKRKHGSVYGGSPVRVTHRSGSGCSVEGCTKKSKTKGLCSGHYGRLLRGEELSRPMNSRGHERWLLDNSEYKGDECLMWPFPIREKGGYGPTSKNGRTTYAHRVMCEIVNGPPPTPSHEAAHSCGKGMQGCVSPSHLRWATRKENAADRVAHGTNMRGEDSFHAVLTESDVRLIRSMRETKSVKEIATHFGISIQTVYAILSGRNWGWLK